MTYLVNVGMSFSCNLVFPFYTEYTSSDNSKTLVYRGI